MADIERNPPPASPTQTPAQLRTLAHDLANLLTVMHGCLELAQRHAAANPALARLLSNLQQATDRADAVQQQLRDLAGGPG